MTSFSRLEKLPLSPAGGVSMGHVSVYRCQFDTEAKPTQKLVTHTYVHTCL